ncbi:MAG: polysaccharide deacetylase family protein, partial [Muribaculaceae bacterium]|nr:polysaccharide deacetylase family protein [Muribaculaceae bacterium]
IKATFFMVGDNVRKYPSLYEEVRKRGHRVGNHTMHHLQGAKCAVECYLKDIAEASRFIESDLFRPPHGWLRRAQAKRLAQDFKIIMYDLVTRDYSRRVDAEGVVRNVRRYSRPGSIIVFHDSLKSIKKLETALPESIEWLVNEGYSFGLL